MTPNERKAARLNLDNLRKAIQKHDRDAIRDFGDGLKSAGYCANPSMLAARAVAEAHQKALDEIDELGQPSATEVAILAEHEAELQAMMKARKWTSERPTVGGFYWIQIGYSTDVCNTVYGGKSGRPLMFRLGGVQLTNMELDVAMFCGPIPMPPPLPNP